MKNPYVALLRTAWHYARQQRGRYLVVYLLFIGANLVGASHPLLFGWFIDHLQHSPATVLTTTVWYGGCFLCLKMLEWAFHGPARILERQLAFDVSRNFMDELYHQTLHLPLGWHKTHHSGATINRINKAYNALKSFFENGFTYLHVVAKFTFSFGAMLYFAPLYGCVGLVLGSFTVWVIRRFDKPFVAALEETNERQHDLSSALYDSLSNIITVLTLRLEGQMQQRLTGKLGAIEPPFRREIRINEWKWFVASMLIAVIYVIITTGYIHQHYVPGTVFYVGGLVTLLGYVNQFTSVFNDVAWQYTQLVQYNTDVQTARRIGEAYGKYRQPEAATLPTAWQTLSVNNLYYEHPAIPGLMGRQPASLKNLSVTLQRGKRVALIGESGSGKSTLLTLLRGLNNPLDGVTWTVDGETRTDWATIGGTVTLFPQEPEIFENTARYNITLGLPFADADVAQVCDMARFADVAAYLPDGLDTLIQEKGVNLSGGQKQRLALARGLLAARQSEIILLDEPTSSVDPKTEYLIYHALLATFTNKAVVSSLHRLHLLPLFDYIYILDNGRIADEGTFADLRQRSTIFREMWRHQSDALNRITSVEV
ncbi:ABC transporter ATP-binding protein [Fibrella aquatilis]|uniref:ABC transporter ATP-binding protein n=1 Tax=Fibrella aquatilis TaxID=2817059 RepID=A0A939K2W7_9BACT|nr:ABC transporter ATP-binding protein [Fibrella aquatilis]MBO0933745.1 ABC transporter ATP-binding protein [Fibrella aquatilis]